MTEAHFNLTTQEILEEIPRKYRRKVLQHAWDVSESDDDNEYPEVIDTLRDVVKIFK